MITEEEINKMIQQLVKEGYVKMGFRISDNRPVYYHRDDEKHIDWTKFNKLQ